MNKVKTKGMHAPASQSVTAILSRNILMPLVLYCLAVRGLDILSSLQTSKISGFMSFFVFLTAAYSMYSPPTDLQKLIKRFVIIGLLFYQLKRELDGAIVEKTSPSLRKHDLVGEVAVVSDAGSVLGRDLVKRLHSMNGTVIMGCTELDMEWCATLASELCTDSTSVINCDDDACHENSAKTEAECVQRIIPLSLDLTDVTSIEAFSNTVHTTYNHLVVDYLVLNSDSSTMAEKTTKQGHDVNFGTVYLGQFMLAQLLLDRLLAVAPLSTIGTRLTARGLDNLDEFVYHDSKANSASKVVYVGSSSSMYGDVENLLKMTVEQQTQLFRPDVAGGLNAAHFALTLSAFELQKRVDKLAEINSLKMGETNNRRLVTSVVNSGFMDMHKSTLMSLAAPYVLRSVAESNHIVLYAMLSNNYVPSSYIDSYLIGHDLMNYHIDAAATHLMAYPSARALKFNLPDPDGVFRSLKGNIEDWFFQLKNEKNDYRALADKLWKASDAVLKKDF